MNAYRCELDELVDKQLALAALQRLAARSSSTLSVFSALKRTHSCQLQYHAPHILIVRHDLRKIVDERLTLFLIVKQRRHQTQAGDLYLHFAYAAGISPPTWTLRSGASLHVIDNGPLKTGDEVHELERKRRDAETTSAVRER